MAFVLSYTSHHVSLGAQAPGHAKITLGQHSAQVLLWLLPNRHPSLPWSTLGLTPLVGYVRFVLQLGRPSFMSNDTPNILSCCLQCSLFCLLVILTIQFFMLTIPYGQVKFPHLVHHFPCPQSRVKNVAWSSLMVVVCHSSISPFQRDLPMQPMTPPNPMLMFDYRLNQMVQFYLACASSSSLRYSMLRVPISLTCAIHLYIVSRIMFAIGTAWSCMIFSKVVAENIKCLLSHCFCAHWDTRIHVLYFC